MQIQRTYHFTGFRRDTEETSVLHSHPHSSLRSRRGSSDENGLELTDTSNAQELMNGSSSVHCSSLHCLLTKQCSISPGWPSLVMCRFSRCATQYNRKKRRLLWHITVMIAIGNTSCYCDGQDPACQGTVRLQVRVWREAITLDGSIKVLLVSLSGPSLSPCQLLCEACFPSSLPDSVPQCIAVQWGRVGT